MAFDGLAIQFKTEKSLMLLRARNPPLVLSFFYKVFIEAHVTTITDTELRSKLEEFLENLQYEKRDE